MPRKKSKSKRKGNSRSRLGSFAKRVSKNKRTGKVIVHTVGGAQRDFPSGATVKDIVDEFADPSLKSYQQPKFVIVDSDGGVGYEGETPLRAGTYTLVKIFRKPLPAPLKRGARSH